MDTRLFTAEALAPELRVSVATLRAWTRQGCPYVSLGRRLVRFKIEDVLKWSKARDTRKYAA